MTKCKIIIADDHPIFRAGLRRIVEDGGYEVLAEVSDVPSCLSTAEILKPDVLILDLSMPGGNGYDVLKWMGSSLPDSIAIIVSMHSSRAYANKARELGARAFVAKEDAADEIAIALKTPPGVFYTSQSVGGTAAGAKPLIEPKEASIAPIGDEPAVDLECLTTTERRVFDLVGHSLTSRQIGEELGLSFRTVQTHRANIVRKLDLKGSNKLLELAVRHHSDGAQ